MKVLPELLKSVEFGGGGPKVLGAIVKIGTKLTQEEYNSKLTPVFVRLFGNPDRALRVSLLESLPLMIDHLPQKIVNDKIFPQMVSDSPISQVLQSNADGISSARLRASQILCLSFGNKQSRLFCRL